jgi:hypothetical protein
LRSRFVDFAIGDDRVVDLCWLAQARQKDAGDDEIQGIDETFVDA